MVIVLKRLWRSVAVLSAQGSELGHWVVQIQAVVLVEKRYGFLGVGCRRHLRLK